MSPSELPQIAAVIRWAALALLVYLVYLVVRPFLVPLGWACVLSVLVYPVHARLRGRIGHSRSAALTTLTTAVVLIGPGVLLTLAFAREMVVFATSLQSSFAEGHATRLQEWWHELTARVPALATVDVAAVASDGLRRAATFLVSESGALLTNVAVFIVDLVLSLFATFFVLRDADAIMRGVRQLLPFESREREAMIARTGLLISAGFTSAVVVAALQGFFGGLAFMVVGLASPLFWGVVMAFACLLPFGAWVVYLPAAVGLVLAGSITKGLVLAALGIGVVSMVDNVVRPILLSERVHINGLVILISLIGGLSVFGLLGLVLGPIVIVTAVALVSSYIETKTITIVPPGGDGAERVHTP
ncbi:MAG: AI-2E family transporter [Vicinamibacterales bacterium]